MESRDFGAVLNKVQALFGVGTVAALSDDYLLDSFLSGYEAAAEVAFEALLNLTVKASLQFAVGRSIGVSAAVASLVDGVLRTMYLAKAKTFAALLATSLTAILASLLIVSYAPRPARSDQPLNVLQVAVPKAVAPEVAVETLKKSEFKRTTTQPGTVQAAESAAVYPRASGFIKNVTVDIGDAVKRGQLLAEIVDPELELGVQKGRALLQQVKTRVLKARSLIRVAQSAVRVQQAKVAESEAGLVQSEPLILLRQKEYDRIAELSRNKQVEPRLVDEGRHRLETAKSARELAKVQISVASAGLDEAQAKLVAAKADAEEVEADLRVAETELVGSQIRASYTRIEAPFDGIVIRRGCNLGEFVRSGTEGGSVPMFSVVGAQKMKVVVNVPDANAPFLDKGDPVDVWMDAQPDRKYAGVIARTAFAEDPATRTLRAEIDIHNNDGRLRQRGAPAADPQDTLLAPPPGAGGRHPAVRGRRGRHRPGTGVLGFVEPLPRQHDRGDPASQGPGRRARGASSARPERLLARCQLGRSGAAVAQRQSDRLLTERSAVRKVRGQTPRVPNSARRRLGRVPCGPVA